jgi:hypothetical protein
MAFSLVQTPGVFTPIVTSLTGSQAFVSNNTAGNLLVAMIHEVGSGPAPSSVTDSQGNTWYQLGASDINISTIFYCPSCLGGPNVVTVHFPTSVGVNGSISVAEYSGQFAAHPVCTAVTPNSSSTQPTASIFTPVAGCLIIGLFSTNGGAVTWSTWAGANPETTATANAIWVDNTNSSSGINTITGQMGAAPDFIAKVVSFLPASYVPAATPAIVTKTEGSAASNGSISVAASPAIDIFPGGNQSGNLLVIAVQQPGTVDNVTGVVDSAGNIYSLQAGGVNQADDSGHRWYSFWTAPVTKPGFANNTVTVSLSSGTAQIAGMEFSNASPTQDATAHGNASFTLTAAKANELIVSQNGFSAGGVNWSGLSGTDLFGVTNVTMEVNFGLSAQGSNTITATRSGGFGGGLSIAFGELFEITGNAGTAGATVSWSGTSSGSTTADGSGNYTIPDLANGSYTITPSKTGFTFSPTSSNQTISSANITGVNFTASSGANVYSVPDCRVAPSGPNASRTVQGTKIYDVQTSSNSAIPPKDCRVAGAPIACGTYPQNSRAPGTFGPGE